MEISLLKTGRVSCIGVQQRFGVYFVEPDASAGYAESQRLASLLDPKAATTEMLCGNTNTQSPTSCRDSLLRDSKTGLLEHRLLTVWLQRCRVTARPHWRSYKVVFFFKSLLAK